MALSARSILPVSICVHPWFTPVRFRNLHSDFCTLHSAFSSRVHPWFITQKGGFPRPLFWYLVTFDYGPTGAGTWKTSSLIVSSTDWARPSPTQRSTYNCTFSDRMCPVCFFAALFTWRAKFR